MPSLDDLDDRHAAALAVLRALENVPKPEDVVTAELLAGAMARTKGHLDSIDRQICTALLRRPDPAEATNWMKPRRTA